MSLSTKEPDGYSVPDQARAEGPDTGLPHGGAARLVRAALIALLALVVALLSIHELNSYDVWTHLACGRLIWEERRIPDQEPFSYTQNCQMTLEEAEPQFAVRHTVLTDAGRLVIAAGAPFDAECRTKLQKAGIPLDKVPLKLEPPLKRLVEDAVDARGNVIVRKGTLLETEQIARLRQAGITKVEVTVPWVNHEWLFQVLAYLSCKYWGLAGPILFKTAILLLACFFVLAVVYRRETHVIGIFAVFLAAIVSYKRFYMRPEVFSILFTGVWLYLLERFRRRQTGWSICVTMPLLMIVWINAHGYFILGPAVMLIYLIGEGVQGLLPMPRKSTQFVRGLFTRKLLWREDIIRGRGLGVLAVATVLTTAATLVNPYGWDGARYPIDVLKQVADPTSVIRTVIGEMQPPLNFDYTYAVSYTWVLLWLSGASWLLNIRRLKFSRLLLYVVSIIFLSKALRNMPFFGIPGAVFLGLNVNESWRDTVGFLREKVVPEALLVAQWVGQALLAALFVYFAVLIVSDRFYVLDVASIRYGLGYTTEKFSMGAVEFVRDNPVEGNLFNSFGMGGLCMWKLYPEKRTGPDGESRLYYGGRRLFIDGRAEVYGGPFVKNYTVSLNKAEQWDELDRKFNFQVVFVNWQASDTHSLIIQLSRDAHWALCYGDGVGYVFVRATPANMDVIEKARRSMEKPEFVDFAEPYERLSVCFPGVPSHRQFVGFQDRIWGLAKILNGDPHLGDEARRVSDTPGQVQFDPRYMTNTYDRFRERVGWLPRRMLSPGDMVGRAQFALTSSFPDLADAIVYGLIQLSPDVAEFYIQRALIHETWGDNWLNQGEKERAAASLKTALEYCRKAEQLDPDYPGLTLQILVLADKLGDAPLTSYYLKRSLDDIYPNVSTSTRIAAVCIRHKLYREALRLYNGVIDVVPERDASALYERIAYCYMSTRNFQRAQANAIRAISLDEANPAAWYTLGVVYRMLGRRDEAIEAFERSLKLSPDFKAPKKQLEELRNAAGVPRDRVGPPPLPAIP